MDNLLEIKNLVVEYKNIKNNSESVLRAVDDVSLNIRQGEIYALAGESGCGKSTLSKAVTNVQMVFQNPYSSLNPKMKIIETLKEPLDINTKFSKNRKMAVIKQVLEEVGLMEDCLQLYPHQFSGGQRQRIAIARALILNPKLLIADEPVSALDASIQAQIINLLRDLRKQRELTILFISHDLNVIRYIADRVGIMYYGKLIEENITSSIFNFPHQEYTRTLLNSAPTL